MWQYHISRDLRVQSIASEIDRTQLVKSYNRDVPPYETSDFDIEEIDRKEIKNNVDETGRMYPCNPIGWFTASSEPEVSYEIGESDRLQEDPAWLYTESCKVIKELCSVGEFVPIILLTVNEDRQVKYVNATRYTPDLGPIVAIGGDISYDCGVNPNTCWVGQKYEKLYGEITNPNKMLDPPIDAHDAATAW